MYRDDGVYLALEQIIKSAGVSIVYTSVPDDCIDGAIWARSDSDARMIMMPDTDEFPDAETACVILGHEMGHILSGLDSPDESAERRKNEAVCDLIGYYLYKLADMTEAKQAESRFYSSFSVEEK